MRYLILIILMLSLFTFAQEAAPYHYLVGAGLSDITGPAADVEMMGYVSPKQKTTGISSRLHARAFVIVDPVSNHRVALVTIDQIHVYDAVTTAVVKQLQALYGDLYTDQNILIGATHTHSAPGGFSRYRLYDLFSSGGFSQQNFDAVVNGISQAIERAHASLKPATIQYNEGDLLDANWSRSWDAYLLNPAEERAEYKYNVDKRMSLLKFTGLDGSEIGEMNWFAVHGTSMKVTNRLISADNKGYAAYRFEKEKGTDYRAGTGFVAAFANSDAGDVSPDDGKTILPNGDWTCELVDSFKCTALSGEKQFDEAKQLYDSASEYVTGPVDYRHTYVDMSNVLVSSEFTGGAPESTCYGAIGLSMLAGTKDHWGVGREKQTCSDPSPLGATLCLSHKCQGNKPVVIATGLKSPYPWTPQVLPLQVIRIGQLALAAVPGEFTTMSGRRMRNTVSDILKSVGVTHVVLAGYANSYAGYVATPEEYQMQNYEGASTHFNEWTLPAYQQETAKLATALAEDRPILPGPEPLDLSKEQERQIPPAHPYDTVPAGQKFGSLITDAASHYAPGAVVQVQFWGGYPNNNLMTNSSFLEVQKLVNGQWIAVDYDWDFDTKYIWNKVNDTQNQITIEWDIPSNVDPGTYRILHRGDAKNIDGTLVPYQGVSSAFQVN